MSNSWISNSLLIISIVPFTPSLQKGKFIPTILIVKFPSK